MKQVDLSPWPKPDWRVVHTDAGPVTLASADDMRQAGNEVNQWVQRASSQGQAHIIQSEHELAAAGAILVPRRSDWPCPPDLQGKVERAVELTGAIGAEDQRSQALSEQTHSGGLFHRIGTWHERSELQTQRDHHASDLRQLLIDIARTAPAATIPEADQHRKAASELQGQADALMAEIQAALAWMKDVADEGQRRLAASHQMGFDALYETAMLQTFGPQPVQSPLVLQSGELAYEALAATLARMVTKTRYVGATSGFSFPIGHTGIRYRVGAFRGQPVQQESLTRLDSGTLVLTNQRVAYIGSTKSTAIPLTKVMHAEVYSNGLSIFQEGKENPNFYFVDAPQHFLFLLNWMLAKSGATQT